MTLYHLFIPGSKTAITNYCHCVKMTQKPILKGSPSQTWDNLSISKDNYNGLKHIKCLNSWIHNNAEKLGGHL